MNILQLNPVIPVVVNSRDGMHKNRPGNAYFILDQSRDHHVLWGVALDDTGEVWWVPNHEVRLAYNWSEGRRPGNQSNMEFVKS